MQRSSIFTALSILALGSLAACNKDRPATEVPAASDATLEDATADADEDTDAGELAGAQAQDDEPGAPDPPTETAGDPPAEASDAVALADVPSGDDDPAPSAPVTTKPKPKPKKKPKKKPRPKTAKKRASKGEAACGEGTCA